MELRKNILFKILQILKTINKQYIYEAIDISNDLKVDIDNKKDSLSEKELKEVSYKLIVIGLKQLSPKLGEGKYKGIYGQELLNKVPSTGICIFNTNINPSPFIIKRGILTTKIM